MPLTDLANATEPVLLRRYHQHGCLDSRQALVERCLPLVRAVAARYRNRGVPFEDLVQVGSIGLIKAIDRFDPERGVKLATYAMPNIAGEIQRYFRDHRWGMRVPRELQEISLRMRSEQDRLSGELGRAPSVAELAEATGVDQEKVLDALQCMDSHMALSLQQRHPETGGSLEDAVGSDDGGFDESEARMLIADAVGALRPREREIVRLRFFGNRSQREIAEEIGISQMHVSRLLRRSLHEMREHLSREAARVA
jgi:RNA polymerase sigma-B factor